MKICWWGLRRGKGIKPSEKNGGTSPGIFLDTNPAAERTRCSQKGGGVAACGKELAKPPNRVVGEGRANTDNARSKKGRHPCFTAEGLMNSAQRARAR